MLIRPTRGEGPTMPFEPSWRIVSHDMAQLSGWTYSYLESESHHLFTSCDQETRAMEGKVGCSTVRFWYRGALVARVRLCGHPCSPVRRVAIAGVSASTISMPCQHLLLRG